MPFITEANELFFLNTWVSALNGTDFIAADGPRADALYATLRSSIQTLYMMHEIDVAANRTASGDTGDDGGAHNVDEAWGIWAGDGTGTCTVLGLAQEAAANAKTGNDVTAETLAIFLALQATAKAGDSPAYNAERTKLLNRGIVLPGIQTVLNFASKMSSDPSAQASAFANFRTIEPTLKAVSPTAVADILSAINIAGAPQADGYATIQAALASPEVLSAFGLTTKDLGIFAPPPPSPSPTPSPTCSFKGNFRIKSVACPGKFLTVPLNCSDTTVALRAMASGATMRTTWKFNANANNFAPIKSARQCTKKVLSTGAKPSLTGSFAPKYKVVPTSASQCSTVNLVSSDRVGKGQFLSVSKDCKSFAWAASGASAQARFIVRSA